MMSEMTSNTISKFFDLIKFVCVLIGCYICKKKNFSCKHTFNKAF